MIKNCPVCKTELTIDGDVGYCLHCGAFIQSSSERCEKCASNMYEISYNLEDIVITDLYCKNCKTFIEWS